MALIAILICTVLICAAHSSPQPENPRLLKRSILKERSKLAKPTAAPTDIAAAIAGCGCSKLYDPVCASSDKSYYNPCQMECDVGANSPIFIKHQGNCVPY